jgi:hypothetical protein
MSILNSNEWRNCEEFTIRIKDFVAILHECVCSWAVTCGDPQFWFLTDDQKPLLLVAWAQNAEVWDFKSWLFN